MTKKISVVLLLFLLITMLFPGPGVSAEPVIILVFEPGTLDVPGATYVLQNDINGSLAITANDVTLDGNGYSLLGPGMPYPDDCFGVWAMYSSGITVKNVRIENFWTGIYYDYSSGTIADCDLYMNYWGIRVHYSHGNIIKNNTLYNLMGYSLEIERSNNNDISGNSITGQISGIELSASRDNVIHENSVNVSGTGIDIYASPGTIISDNLIVRSVTGMLMFWMNGCTVANNTFTNTYRSIYLRYTNDCEFYENELSNNKYEGLLLQESNNNLFYHNSFINNNQQVRITGTVTGINRYNVRMPAGGNYWDNWTGPDEDGNGIVDVPYCFYPGMQDNYPWVEPGNWPTEIPDNDLPVADVGPDQVLEQENALGSVTTLDGTASSDPDGDALTYSWSAEGIVFDDPTSETPSALFPAGTTIVQLIVNDGTADSAADTVSITVQDTISPEVYPPADISVISAELVSLDIGSATATDAVGVTAMLNNAPDMYSPGETTVTWTAYDAAGNYGTAEQIITVQTPDDATQEVISEIENLALPQGTETSLVSKLDNAIKSIEKNNTESSINQLEASINQVQAQRGKKLTDEQADILIEMVEAIIDALY